MIERGTRISLPKMTPRKTESGGCAVTCVNDVRELKNPNRILRRSQEMSAYLKSHAERPILSLEDCPGGLPAGVRREQTVGRKVKP